MSLDDKFNPNDGTLIDRIDSFIFNINQKMAVKWQDKTGRSKDELQRHLSFFSGTMFGGLLMKNFEDKYIFGLIAGIAYGIYGHGSSRGSLETDLSYEASGFPRKFPKFIFSVAYVTGVSMSTYGIIKGTMDLYEGRPISESVETMMLGLGILGLTSADYISRSDIGNPPGGRFKDKQEFRSVVEIDAVA